MKTIKTAALALMAAAAMVSCTRNFEEINTNPNTLNYGEIKAYNCIEPLIYGMGYQMQYYTFWWVNSLVQYNACTYNTTRHQHQYQILESDWQGLWNEFARFGGDAKHMIDLARQDEDGFYEGVGLILKAYNLYILTTMYGDIPYDEAYRFSENLTPAFESQEQVLLNIIRDYDAACAVLKSSPKPGKSGLDPVFGDSCSKWRKLAGSLRLRALLILTGIDEKYWNDIQEMLNNPSDYPVFASNADNAFIPFQLNDPYRSYFGQASTTEDSFCGYRLTEQLIGDMVIVDKDGNTLYNDPRLPIYGTINGTKWAGTIAGCTNVQRTEAESRKPAVPNFKVLVRDDAPYYIMDYSEILFIEAEGVLKGKLTIEGQTAKSLYEAAVRASIERWAPFIQYNSRYRDVQTAEIDAYIVSDLASYDKAESGEGLYKNVEQLLGTQKWLALYWTGFNEPYNNWRRTEYPILTIGDGTDYNDFELPTRFCFPNYTCSTNREHVNAALERMGGDNDMHLALDWSYKKHNGGNRNPHPNATK